MGGESAGERVRGATPRPAPPRSPTHHPHCSTLTSVKYSAPASIVRARSRGQLVRAVSQPTGITQINRVPRPRTHRPRASPVSGCQSMPTVLRTPVAKSSRFEPGGRAGQGGGARHAHTVEQGAQAWPVRSLHAARTPVCCEHPSPPPGPPRPTHRQGSSDRWMPIQRRGRTASFGRGRELWWGRASWLGSE